MHHRFPYRRVVIKVSVYQSSTDKLSSRAVCLRSGGHGDAGACILEQQENGASCTPSGGSC